MHDYTDCNLNLDLAEQVTSEFLMCDRAHLIRAAAMVATPVDTGSASDHLPING